MVRSSSESSEPSLSDVSSRTESSLNVGGTGACAFTVVESASSVGVVASTAEMTLASTSAGVSASMAVGGDWPAGG